MTNFSCFALIEFRLIETEVFKNFIVINFFVNGNSFFTVEIDNIFANFAERLEFVGILTKGTTTRKSTESIITDTETIENLLIAFGALLVKDVMLLTVLTKAI